MIRPDQIPNEVAWKLHDKLWRVGGPSVDEARAAIAAALGAWPGAHVHEWQRPWLGGMSGTDIILPLSTEASDEG